MHDSEMIGGLFGKKDCGQKLYADSAYRSEKIEEELKRKKVMSMVHEKGYRNKPLTIAQQKRNRRKSKVPARVEHIFGFMTNSMNRINEHYLQFIQAYTDKSESEEYLAGPMATIIQRWMKSRESMGDLILIYKIEAQEFCKSRTTKN